MKKFTLLLLLTAGISITACSTSEQGQNSRDTFSLDTINTPEVKDSINEDALRDTMPARRDTV